LGFVEADPLAIVVEPAIGEFTASQFEVRQKADVITGRYQPMTLPSPETAIGKIYFDFKPIMANGKAEPLGRFVAFYSPKSDTVFLVEGQGARDRLLARGPHPEFALELRRMR
jgi:hypothetical protein